MAHISNLVLSAKPGKTKAKAEIDLRFDVLFSPSETKLNLRFGLFVMLYEVDRRPDVIVPIPNGFNALHLPHLDPSLSSSERSKDDAIGWMKSEVISPGQKSSISVHINETITLKGKDVRTESFRACAYVIPEITSGFAWSNQAKVEGDGIAATEQSAIQRQPAASDLSTANSVEQKQPAKKTAKTVQSSTRKTAVTPGKPTASKRKVAVSESSSPSAAKKKTPAKKVATKVKVAATSGETLTIKKASTPTKTEATATKKEGSGTGTPEK